MDIGLSCSIDNPPGLLDEILGSLRPAQRSSAGALPSIENSIQLGM
jgi:hypothetical protein